MSKLIMLTVYYFCLKSCMELDDSVPIAIAMRAIIARLLYLTNFST